MPICIWHIFVICFCASNQRRSVLALSFSNKPQTIIVINNHHSMCHTISLRENFCNIFSAFIVKLEKYVDNIRWNEVFQFSYFSILNYFGRYILIKQTNTHQTVSVHWMNNIWDCGPKFAQLIWTERNFARCPVRNWFLYIAFESIRKSCSKLAVLAWIDSPNFRLNISIGSEDELDSLGAADKIFETSTSIFRSQFFSSLNNRSECGQSK